MRQTFSRLTGRLAALISFFKGFAQHQADRNALTRHIVAINSKQTVPEIMNEAALCLKTLLNYRLFAFAIKKEKGIDVWLDPRMYRKSLEEVLRMDFCIQDGETIRYLNHSFGPDENGPAMNIDRLIHYEWKSSKQHERIYLLPGSGVYSHQDEAVRLILQSCSSAIDRLERMDDLKSAAVIDPLTGCYNRREFENQLKRHIAGAVRYKSDLSVFMFDLDHFKQINDTYGHLGGDQVLKTIASKVQRNMRTGDILARYGGEEFIAILPETGRAKAMELADRLRQKIANAGIPFDGQTIRVTASFGVAELDRCADMEKIIQDADAMLYKAKLNGRNTVMPGLIKVVQPKVGQAN